MNSDEPLDGHGEDGVDRAGEGDLGQGEEGGDQVGEHLVAVGLTQEGDREDGQVGEDAESVEYAETGNQTTEGGLEAEICFVDDTQTYQVACNIIYLTDQQF